MDRQIFLARHGKTEGPFTETQLEELTASGEFYKYEWMWDGQSPDWQPVPRRAKAPPPRPEVTITKIEAPAASFTPDAEADEVPEEDYDSEDAVVAAPVPAAKSKSRYERDELKSDRSATAIQTSSKSAKSPRSSSTTTGEGKRYSAILYDHEKAFSGKVWKKNEKSAKFLTGSSHHPFKMGQVVWVDLLQEEKDQAYKMRGAIENIQHSTDGWEMTLLLDSFPI